MAHNIKKYLAAPFLKVHLKVPENQIVKQLHPKSSKCVINIWLTNFS